MSKAPNIPFLMSDRMGAPAFSLHGNSVCQTPHVEALAGDSVVFDSAYANYRLCTSARFSLLSGRLAVNIKTYGNGSP